MSLYRRYRTEFWLVALGALMLGVIAVVQRVVMASGGGTNFIYLVGAPLDDVYIHCRFAQNLLRGEGFAFNPGHPLSADTSPLWVVLIAIGGLVTSHLEVVAVALSAIFYLLISPGVYRTARDLFGLGERWSFVAGLVTVICSRLLWSAASGMEVTLAALLMLLVVEEHIRGIGKGAIRPREGVLLGLGFLVRPEFAFLGVLCYTDWIWLGYKKRAQLSRLPATVLWTLLLTLPYIFYVYRISGSFVSHSSVVQGAHVSLLPNWEYLWFALRIYASNNVMAFLLLAIGSLTLIKQDKGRVAVLLVIGLPILQAFVAPQFRHHGRYFFPVFPVMILLACVAASKYSEKIGRVIIALLLLGGLVEAGRWILIESEAVRNINDQHLAIVDWANHNAKPSDVFAVDDVGALAYFTDRPLIDLTGLMTPEIFALQSDQNAVWKKARQMGANMFIIYNRLNPTFYQAHQDSLELLNAFTVRLPLVSAADTTMRIYRLKEATHGTP
ncbi:MAG: hypothetical protein ABI444_02760 [Candidatus Kapaibacterium sp.]|jgi:arabinofuranosyltransferase